MCSTPARAQQETRAAHGRAGQGGSHPTVQVDPTPHRQSRLVAHCTGTQPPRPGRLRPCIQEIDLRASSRTLGHPSSGPSAPSRKCVYIADVPAASDLLRERVCNYASSLEVDSSSGRSASLLLKARRQRTFFYSKSTVTSDRSAFLFGSSFPSLSFAFRLSYSYMKQ